MLRVGVFSEKVGTSILRIIIILLCLSAVSMTIGIGVMKPLMSISLLRNRNCF